MYSRLCKKLIITTFKLNTTKNKKYFFFSLKESWISELIYEILESNYIWIHMISFNTIVTNKLS